MEFLCQVGPRHPNLVILLPSKLVGSISVYVDPANSVALSQRMFAARLDFSVVDHTDGNAKSTFIVLVGNNRISQELRNAAIAKENLSSFILTALTDSHLSFSVACILLPFTVVVTKISSLLFLLGGGCTLP